MVYPVRVLASGSRLGAHEIIAPLDAGGMGEVYRARDTRLPREVAVKVLPADGSTTYEYCGTGPTRRRLTQASPPGVATESDILSKIRVCVRRVAEPA